MKKLIALPILCFLLNVCNGQTLTQQQFLDQVHQNANVIMAHDHEFSDSQLATSGTLGYTKTLQLVTDLVEWVNGTRVEPTSVAAFNAQFGTMNSLLTSRLDTLNQEDANGTVNIIRNSYELVKPAAGVTVPNIVLATEGVGAFESNLANIDLFYNQGLRQIQLERDKIFDAISGGNLTTFGNGLISKCNSKGIAIDVSHLVRNFQPGNIINAVIAQSSDPVMISHQPFAGGSYNDVNEKAAMLAVASDGGIVCVQFYKPFIPNSSVAGLANAIYGLKNTSGIGIDHIGLGGDYFPETGAEWVPATLSNLDDLTIALYNKGFTVEEVIKIYGANLKAYYASVWNDACVTTSLPFTVENGSGITVGTSAITKTSATGWGNSGGSSSSILDTDDFLTYKAGTGKGLMVGLSAVDTNTDYHSIEYAVYTKDNNTVFIYENGTVKTASLGTYTATSVFKISVGAQTVRYFMDDVLLYTSVRTAPGTPLHADFSFYTTGGVINSLQLFNGCCLDSDDDGVCDDYDLCPGFDDHIDTNNNGIPDGCETICTPAALTYAIANPVGISVSANSIVKTSAVGWGNGGGSSDIVLSNNDYLTYQVLTGHGVMVGLSPTDTNANYTSIPYALYARSDNKLYVYEGSTTAAAGPFTASYTSSSVLKIEVKDGKVKYYHNGVLLPYQSTISNPSVPLHVDFSMYTQNSAINNLSLYTGCCDDDDHDGVCNGSDLCPGFNDHVDENDNGIPDGCEIPCTFTSMSYTVTGQVGITVSAGDVTKTAATGWTNGGGASSLSLSEGDYITYKVLPGNAVMVGLSDTNTNADYHTIDYALYSKFDNNLFVYENGIASSLLGTYNANSIFKIEMKNGFIHYYVDGVALNYQSAWTSPSSLIVDFAMYTQNSKIINLQIFSCESTGKPGNALIEKSVEASITDSIKIYPNPGKGLIYCNLKGTLKIYNNAGQLVLRSEHSDVFEGIDIGRLPLGIYNVTVEAKSGRESIRFVKD